MQTFCLILLVACGQVNNPAPVPADWAKDTKAAIIAEMLLNPQTTPEKVEAVRKQLNQLTEDQLRAVVKAYEMRKVQQAQLGQQNQQALLQQAQLDNQEAQAFSRHLDREYQQRLLQGHMEQNLFTQNMLNNQRAMYGNWWGAGALHNPGFYNPNVYNTGVYNSPGGLWQNGWYQNGAYAPYNSGYYGYHQGTPPSYPSWTGNTGGYGYYGW